MRCVNEWIKIKGNEEIGDTVQCPFCSDEPGFKFFESYEMFWYGKRYCPNCGKKLVYLMGWENE